MYFHLVAWYIHINPTARTGRVNKSATHAKNQNNNQDIAANSIHIIKNMKSAKIVKITEKSQPNDCFM
jgi:hypothetical protein